MSAGERKERLIDEAGSQVRSRTVSHAATGYTENVLDEKKYSSKAQEESVHARLGQRESCAEAVVQENHPTANALQILCTYYLCIPIL